MSLELTDEVKRNIEIYESVIFDISNLFVSLGINRQPVKVFETLYYMITNNYLSKSIKKDCPPSFNKLENLNYVPLDIIGSFILAGYGVCRHKADLINRVCSSLGYKSSQLFVYSPNVNCSVDLIKGVPNSRIQKYLDDALKDLDYFSDSDISYEKKYQDAVVNVSFRSPKWLLNHTINIVSELDNNTIHIFDSLHHMIGISKKSVRLYMAYLDIPGIKRVYFTANPNIKSHIFDFKKESICSIPECLSRNDTYYDTNYVLGFNLYGKFKSKNLNSYLSEYLSYIEKIKEFIPEFENFKYDHEEQYRQVLSNYRKLFRKI